MTLEGGFFFFWGLSKEQEVNRTEAPASGPAVVTHPPHSAPRRINIGARYQAEVPELRQRAQAERDHPGAELVWAPLARPEEQQKGQERGSRAREGRPARGNVLSVAAVDDLMHLACSSAFYGGGTNQELAHHCLHQCQGDVMVRQLIPLGREGRSLRPWAPAGGRGG